MSKTARILFGLSIVLISSTLFAFSPVGATGSNTFIRRVLFDNCYTPSLIAAKADLYMCHFNLGFRVPAIHQIRPDLICLLYRDIRAVSTSSSEYQVFLSKGWILKDASGTLIRDTYYGDKRIIDPGNVAYQTWVANWLKGYLDEYGYNGVFLDNLLPSTEYIYGTSPSSPINPRTGKVFTAQDFEQAIIKLVNTVKSTIGNRLVIGNSIFNGERFFQSSRYPYLSGLLLQSNIDGIESEDWLLTLYSATWISEATWQASINFTVWLENNFFAQRPGRMFLPVCQNAGPYDAPSPVLPSGCTKEQYALFCFASLLLGATTSGSNLMNFANYAPSDYPQSLFQIDVGTPLGNYYMMAGTHVYTRDFSKVKVLVNPTSNSYSVSLSGKYQTLSGQAVTMPLTVAPHTATILKSSSSSPLITPLPATQPLFQSGFELGSFNEWNGVYTTGGGTATISSTLEREGVYSARFTTDGGGSVARAYCYENLGGEPTVYALAYVYVNSSVSLSAGNALWVIQFRDSGGSVLASYGFKNNGGSVNWACMYGGQNVFSSSGPQSGVWYAVEAFFTKASSGKTLTIFVNGQEAASLSVDTSGANSVARVCVGIGYNDPSYSFNIYVDTITVARQYI